jgi:hypothetical protein
MSSPWRLLSALPNTHSTTCDLQITIRLASLSEIIYMSISSIMKSGIRSKSNSEKIETASSAKRMKTMIVSRTMIYLIRRD